MLNEKIPPLLWSSDFRPTTGFSGSAILPSLLCFSSAPHPSSFYLYKACVMRLLVLLLHSTQPDCRAWAPGHRLGSAHAGWRPPMAIPWRGSPVSWRVTRSIKLTTQNWCHLKLFLLCLATTNPEPRFIHIPHIFWRQTKPFNQFTK